MKQAENPLKKQGTTALEKVEDVVEAYAKWSYKSKGGELGFYTANTIKLDDRLNDSVQIATLIHELAHHLLAEIHEQILMYFWEVEKKPMNLKYSSSTSYLQEQCT